VTWKVADGALQHIDVREEGKENVFSLGRSLWIANEVPVLSLCPVAQPTGGAGWLGTWAPTEMTLKFGHQTP